MIDPVTNFGRATVSTGYDAAAAAITLSSGHGANFPDTVNEGPFNLVWWNITDYSNPADDPNREIIRCTYRATDYMTIDRAQEGTTATTKNTAGKTYKVILVPTKRMIDDTRSLGLNGLPIIAGVDGDVTISGTTTLTRDMYYSNLTVVNAGILNTAGYRLFVQTKTYVAYGGTIRNNGSNGADSVGTTGGVKGAGAPSGSVSGGTDGGDGANGVAGGGVAGGSATGCAKSIGGAGRNGAAGQTTAYSGGPAGVAGALTGTVYNSVNNPISAFFLMDAMPSPAPFSGGSGGGGGGSGGGASNGFTPGEGAGGGGGGGGIVAIFTNELVVNGAIQANGGNGGTGTYGPGGNQQGSGGDGGGGGGGAVVLVYVKKSGSGSITATGGTGNGGATNGNVYEIVYGAATTNYEINMTESSTIGESVTRS